MSTTTSKAKRAPRVLAKPIKNTLDGSGIIRPARGNQSHVLIEGSPITLCGMDTSTWVSDPVAADRISCPYCAKAVKASATDHLQAAQAVEFIARTSKHPDVQEWRKQQAAARRAAKG